MNSLLSSGLTQTRKSLTLIGVLIVLLSLLLSGCAVPISSAPGVAPQMESISLQAGPCSGKFVAHPLDFTTYVQEWPVRMFGSNGSGLGINDLNQDGLLDLVFGNLDAQNAVFWNEGGLQFRKVELPAKGTRNVSVIDINGDGWLDLSFALRRFVPVAYYNVPGPDGERTFERQVLSLFTNKTYSMAWADLDLDGDLDAVLSTYDAEPIREANNTFLPTGGTYIMSQTGLSGEFTKEQLAIGAHALAVLLADFNGDDRLDILVGHDFELPDQVFVQSAAGWQETRVFPEVTRNTMSFAPGDLDNDGNMELFAADMKPFKTDEETMAAWMPLMEKMDFEVTGGQVMHNVLQVQSAAGVFEDRADAFALANTGWTWSAQFGDLDNDGLLDLYVVNGMHSEEMFSHLPDAELVEENLVFRNTGDEGFEWMEDWGLNSLDGGRSMGLADLDLDGDLDVVINNLLDPAMVYENQLCGGQGLEVDLFWPDSGNTRALGATVSLWTDVGLLVREVRSNSGYLTGEPARLHFGFPEGTDLHRLDVRWPDGQMSYIFRPEGQTLLSLTRSE